VRAPAAAERDRLIERHLPLVRAMALRYAGYGEAVEDLFQVGAIGLIKAVDRYDAARGAPLEHYAASVIAGEIRHHLRDRCAPVRLPRRLHGDGVRVRFEPLVTGDDMPFRSTPDPAPAVDERLALSNAFRALHPRTRRLLVLCYFADLSQAQAAATLGISRVQASRLLHEALGTLRGALADPGSGSASEPAVASAGSRG
jgi:RNA polymerase sigma-B factor